MADAIKNKDQLLSLTLRQLRQEASKLSVPLYSRKTKVVLVELILKYQKNNTARIQKEIKTTTSTPPSKAITSDNSESINTNVVFLPRDPEWAYVFWQISESDRQKAQSLGANKLCLRLYDASSFDGDNVNQGTLREIAVDSYSTEWYLPIPLADRAYKVELGYKYGFNWMSLAFSSTSHVPGSHPSEQILDKFVPFNLESSPEMIPDITSPQEQEVNGAMHERLYQAATNVPLRRKVGSEFFMENMNSINSNENLTDSGVGKWSSGLTDSGSGIVKNRSFWLVADAELIVYGATEPSAKLTIGGEDVPLAADGTFRIQVPFRDGTQKYDIKAVDAAGLQEKNISMKFDRETPFDDTNERDNAEKEWF